MSYIVIVLLLVWQPLYQQSRLVHRVYFLVWLCHAFTFGLVVSCVYIWHLGNDFQVRQDRAAFASAVSYAIP